MKKNFLFIKGQDVVNKSEINDVTFFQKHWDNLPVDKYMKDGDEFRYRRCSKFIFDPENKTLELEYGKPFYQSTTVNKYIGGINRYYDECMESFYKSTNLLKLVLFNYKNIKESKSIKWEVSIQQVRITARKNKSALPAPEGLHSDGFTYVCLHLINRVNILGGESSVENKEGDVLFKNILLSPLDTLIVDDRKVLHNVSPIYLNFTLDSGFRDMMIINFEKPL